MGSVICYFSDQQHDHGNCAKGKSNAADRLNEEMQATIYRMDKDDAEASKSHGVLPTHSKRVKNT